MGPPCSSWHVGQGFQPGRRVGNVQVCGYGLVMRFRQWCPVCGQQGWLAGGARGTEMWAARWNVSLCVGDLSGLCVQPLKPQPGRASGLCQRD